MRRNAKSWPSRDALQFAGGGHIHRLLRKGGRWKAPINYVYSPEEFRTDGNPIDLVHESTSLLHAATQTSIMLDGVQNPYISVSAAWRCPTRCATMTPPYILCDLLGSSTYVSVLLLRFFSVFVIQTLTSQTAERRPVKSASGVWFYILHEEVFIDILPISSIILI